VSLLQVTNLTVRYQGRPAVVDGVSLSIEAGEVVGLSGPSGCGKTTLALSIMGLLPADADVSGSIRFGTRELRGMPENDLEAIRGAEIGLVFQESALALNPVLTAGAQIIEVVRAHQRCSHAEAVERARESMRQVGFDRECARVFDAYPHELSGGERQRILIAQATVCRPALIIADEPVASLDDETRGQVLTLLRTLTERLDTSLLMITHSAEVLSSTADRVIEMKAGRVVAGRRSAGAMSISVSRVSRTNHRSVASDPIVDVIGLTRRYQRRGIFGKARPPLQALKGVELLIARGSTLGLTGRSGCGKSTLARCIAGLETPDAGQVRINGTDIARLRGRALLPYRNQVQLIFQDSAAALNPRFTALDIVTEAMVIQGVGKVADRRDRAADLMTQVGLSPNRLQSLPGEFSGGERQRLAIARALAVKPHLLILDEALSGLDLVTRERVVRLLMELQATHGLTYLCISHDLDFLSRFATDVVVMHDGGVQGSDPLTRVDSRGLTPQGAVA
jgi:ABC-type glutathione transport system ATPase component